MTTETNQQTYPLVLQHEIKDKDGEILGHKRTIRLYGRNDAGRVEGLALATVDTYHQTVTLELLNSYFDGRNHLIQITKDSLATLAALFDPDL